MWYGHINRMEDNRNVKAIMDWNSTDRRLRGRPKTRWKDDVKIDLRAMKITEWEKRAGDKLMWEKGAVRIRRRRRRRIFMTCFC